MSLYIKPPRRVQDLEQQVETFPISADEIMRTTAFRQGVADVRANRRPRYDGEFIDDAAKVSTTPGDRMSFTNQCWNYERGRAFAILAPHSLRIIDADGLNPKAVRFFRRCELIL
jgi:hypothetical protein